MSSRAFVIVNEIHNALSQKHFLRSDPNSHYERKADNPSLDFIERCAAALHVTVHDLIADNPKTRAAKPGPPAKWEQLSRRLAALPRGKQQVVIEMLEGLLEKTGT